MRNGNRGTSHKSLVMLMLGILLLSAGMAGAQEQVWPVKTKLLVNLDNVVQAWSPVGDVTISNTKDQVRIDVVPSNGRGIAKVGVQVASDPTEFAALLDNKGQPKLSLFKYVTEYKKAVASHRQMVDMSTLALKPCWAVDPVKCPPNRYILVAVELQGLEQMAYAGNGGIFDRYIPAQLAGLAWGLYVTYPLAKAEPGHFVDANVSGLTYLTPTQGGTTGSEGQFWWLPGERIDFWVGRLPLGSALADRAVSPVDLFPGADLEDSRVLNVARLLQSLDGDGNPGFGSINITAAVVGCLNGALTALVTPLSPTLFSDDAAVTALIDRTVSTCAGTVALKPVTKEEALANLGSGMKSGNLMARNVSKSPSARSDKAQLEIMDVYVPARRSDGTTTNVDYHDAAGAVIETRNEAKPLVVSYLDEVGGNGAFDVFVAVSLDDGDTWKRRNISRTANNSSLFGKPGSSWKPMLEVQDNMIFVAWTDKYCKGGRPGYAITKCDDTDGDGTPEPCTVCRTTAEGVVCTPDYPGDDAYFKEDLFGVAGPQRSVLYEDYPEKGEVPYSCVWAARGVLDETSGDVKWYKPERVTSGRRDAFQLVAASHADVGFAIAWQEDPKGLMPGEGDGPGEGWSGANTHNKADIWLSYLKKEDFAAVDPYYPTGGHGDGDLVDDDPELGNRVKALVPMSMPVKVSDNDICSLENMLAEGGKGEHDNDEEGEGTHCYCGDPAKIGTKENPGENTLCAYTFPRTNPNGEVHNVCVTADGRLLDGNTGASRPNLNLQPYTKEDGTKSAAVVIGYEESKGVGVPPEHDDPHEGDDHAIGEEEEHDPDDRYKPDMGKNIIYHSFDLFSPETVAGGVIVNLPETDAAGNVVYVKNEDGTDFLDWKLERVLAYENARRVRFLIQPKGKVGKSGTILAIIYRQGEEGSGKPADIFMRSLKAAAEGNPYAPAGLVSGARNLTSVTPTVMFQDPFDADKPNKMLRWSWTPDNLADSSAKNPHTDARAHRGALSGDELLVAYTWTPNWGRKGNDKYDLYVHRSFDGGGTWTTDPKATETIEHSVAWRVPIVDTVNLTVLWDEEVVTTSYPKGAIEPPRNVSNLRNNRTTVEEPRVVKTPGTILTDGLIRYPEDKQKPGVFQVAWGLDVNQNALPEGGSSPKMPLDIYYGRTLDKGQRYESVVVTPQNGSGHAEEGFSLLAKDHPEQGGVQVRQTPDGSRMYATWLEQSSEGSDIMFRRVDYR